MTGNMDILAGLELAQYQSSALHTSRIPRTVYTPNGGSLLEDVEDRNAELIGDFSRRRKANAVTNRRLGAATNAFGSSDTLAAIPKFYSPEDFYIQSMVPYKISDETQRKELLRWMDLYYRTHTLIPILVDIFTRFPLVGMELDSPDKDLTSFYTDLFLDDLDYPQLLVDIGREYWTLGESWPLGHFNETLGVWESEELLAPDLVSVRKYPIIGSEQFFLTPPPELVEVAKRRKPEMLWYLLQQNHADIIPFLQQNKPIPVSDVLLKQVAFKVSPRDLHGTPILLRALRQLIHEEKLLAAQDAVAERLYSPLLLVKLGVQDMGANRAPWIPGPEHVASLRNDLDIALSADFRILVHHFGIDVQNVWGREQMPRLDADFDRIEAKLMQTFGMNPNLLSGGASAQPYASSALQAEFLNQILRTYQRFLIKHYEARARIVAEAQEHYAFEKRGDTRIPIMEEVVEYDEETGEEVIVEKHKLLIPDLKMKVLDLRDEATQRQFLQVLRQAGVPISDSDLAMGMGYDFEEQLGRVEDELIQKTVSQQDAKVKAYDILAARGLPIPPDLKQEIEGAGSQLAPGESTSLDVTPPGVGDQIQMPMDPDAAGGDMGPDQVDTAGGGVAQPAGPNSPMRGNVPEPSLQSSPLRAPGSPGGPGGAGGLMSPVGPAGGGVRANYRLASTDPKEKEGDPLVVSHYPRKARRNTLENLQKFSAMDYLTDEEKDAMINTKDDEETSRG